MSDDFCAYCFGTFRDGEERVQGRHGRRYHPGHEKLDQKMPRLGDGGAVQVGGRGGELAVRLSRQSGQS